GNFILEFADATLFPAPLDHAGLQNITLRLTSGELALIKTEPGNEQLPLADLAEGLLAPDQGVVRFLGESWSAISPEQSLILRAGITRVFDEHGWISNLNVNENVTLAQRHHTRRPIRTITDEAEVLARSFNLEALPAVRPAQLPRRDLRRCEWIRAFLGRPKLVLLERPMKGVPLEFLPRLIGAAKEAMAHGTALLWLTDEDQVWQNPSLWDATRYVMHGQTLTTVEVTMRTGNKH
ncbi:MAG: hypothetical protein NTW03_23440, partial [Verrucomicrobia bacterium]|nr:hypothetical protein [Verrucomicrobiota bacterium]